MLERNSFVPTNKLESQSEKMFVPTNEITKINTNSSVTADELESASEIRQLQLANLPNFPLREFLSISFTHHITILAKAKTYEERVYRQKMSYKECSRRAVSMRMSNKSLTTKQKHYGQVNDFTSSLKNRGL